MGRWKSAKSKPGATVQPTRAYSPGDSTLAPEESARPDDGLGRRGGILAEVDRFIRPVRVDDVDREHVAAVVVPDFVLMDAMEGGEILAGEKEVDRRRERAITREAPRQGPMGDALRRPVGFAVEPAFGVRDQTKTIDPLACRGGKHRGWLRRVRFR